MDLTQIDLNLLVTLRVLLEEQSVTRAAKRLRLSQPALSNALNRLRTLFKDPLLTRNGPKMTPTLRAVEIAAELEKALGLLEGTLAQQVEFAPRESSQSFSLAATDYIEMVLLPGIAQRVSREAPKVSLDIRHIGESPTFDLLSSGAIEVAIGVFFQAPAGVYRQELFRERLVCIARQRHPAVHKGAMSLEDFAAQSHLLVASKRGEPGIIDQKLSAHGMKRHIAMYIPHFLIAPQLVAGSDLIATLPERAARQLAGPLSLVLFEPPFALTPFPVSQIWHERTHQNPAHRWLREVIQKSTQESQQRLATSKS